MPADLDLRKLRYFLAVAEHRHFGRAAAQLRIAQPVLSRQIRALERELGTALLVRDRRRTDLTPAGEQLREEAGPLLARATAVQRRIAATARGGAGTFTVGFMPGLTVTAEVRALREANPGLDVEVVRTSWDTQAEVIRDGRVDVGYVRLPIDERDLALEPLFEEARVVVVAADHPLAGRPRVSIEELGDEHLLQNPAVVPEWRDDPRGRGAWRATEVPALTVEEKLEYVAAGRGIIVLPLSTALFYSRPDVTHSAVHDIGPNRICLAWAADSRSRLVRQFLTIAVQTHRPGTPGQR
ncbi:LysR family transcriptional regulator [Micromonospora avicenniae]|uniref:DNA-binding transcriptional regulator, LysR family n=1 Tax=Micromonospora avicenniae TaxID=1198245 RepID=A0A1N6WU39_9ACTN|nr:LysR substrate-binding domain-containing protein [Micromonospora avicenniae]SIQ93617.1 DNA-binding transcriptional regulator, LysR family [Micromonospora avicenniae]